MFCDTHYTHYYLGKQVLLLSVPVFTCLSASCLKVVWALRKTSTKGLVLSLVLCLYYVINLKLVLVCRRDVLSNISISVFVSIIIIKKNTSREKIASVKLKLGLCWCQCQ